MRGLKIAAVALGVIFLRLTGIPERDLAEMIEFERALAARAPRPRQP